MALAAKKKLKGGSSSSSSLPDVGARATTEVHASDSFEMTGRCDSDEVKSPSLALAAAAAMVAIDSLRDLESIPPAILCMGEEIKRGRFKKVYRGKFKRRSVIILQYSKDGDSNELFIIGSLARRGSSRYIPEVCGVCYDETTTSIVEELAAWGALKSAMKSPESSSRMTPHHRCHIVFQVSRAMAFLQMLRVVHADLSCRNVLLFRIEDDARLCVAKVTDFGLAFELPEGVDCEHRKQPQATRWCSPETVSESKLSFRSDVWSFGAMSWELFSGGASLPWKRLDKRVDVATRLKELAELAKVGDDASASEAANLIGEEFPIVGGCPSEVHDIILSCLQVVETSRPTFLRILELMHGILGDEERLPTNLDEMLGIFPKEQDEVTKGDPSGKLFSPSSTTARGLLSTPSIASPPSTTDTLEGFDSQRAALNLEGIATDPAIGASSSSFRLLRQFLESPQAVQAAGEDAVREMRSEIEEAEGREQQRSASTSNLLSTVSTAPAGGLGRQSSTEYLVPLVAASGPLVSDGRQRLPPSNGNWTLTSFLRPAILRQDFECEEDARAAFEAAASGETLDGPCVLRNPEGIETDSRSWVAAESSLTPRGRARSLLERRSPSTDRNAALDRRRSPSRRSPSGDATDRRRSPSGNRSFASTDKQPTSVRSGSFGAPVVQQQQMAPLTSKSLSQLPGAAPPKRPASSIVAATALTGFSRFAGTRHVASSPRPSMQTCSASSSIVVPCSAKAQCSSVAPVASTVVDISITPPATARQQCSAIGEIQSSSQIAPLAVDVSSTIGSESGFNQTWPKSQLASALMSLPLTPKHVSSGKASRVVNAPVVAKASGGSATLAVAQRGRRSTTNLTSRSTMPAVSTATVQGALGPKRSARGVREPGGSSLRTSSR